MKNRDQYLEGIESLAHNVVSAAVAEGTFDTFSDGPKTTLQQTITDLARHLRYKHECGDGCTEDHLHKDNMDTIQYADFAKLDIRTGTITNAELVPKSKKLVKLEVDFGSAGKRTIVAGIASMLQHALVPGDPAMLVGTGVCAILNMEPRALMGIQSHGMILAAHDNADSVQLVKCLGVPDGSQVG